MICEAVASLLRTNYKIVASVEDGQALIEAAMRMKPDIIVTDISMPALDGIKAASILRDSGSKSRIIFLTIHQDLDFIKACFAAGALGYVTKPRMSTDLLSAVEEALVGHRFVSPIGFSVANFAQRKRRYEVGFDRKEGNTRLYRITEHDQEGIVRTFTGTVSASQQRSATKVRGMNTDERQVERWCELKQDRLPPHGGTVKIDLNEVNKH
jgi:DNA-binding NarL/FixJ family response regulator